MDLWCWTLHLEVKPPAGTAARLQRLFKKCEESSYGPLDEICSPISQSPSEAQPQLKLGYIKVSEQRP